MKYAKFGKVNLKNRVSLNDSNILERAQFHMEKHSGISLPGILFHMCMSE